LRSGIDSKNEVCNLLQTGNCQLLNCYFLATFFLPATVLRLSFPGTTVGTGTLATDRQSFTMTQPAVAGNIQQTLNIHLGFTAQCTFGLEFVVDNITNGCLLIIIPLVHFLVKINAGLAQDNLAVERPIPLNVSEANFRLFYFLVCL